MYSVSLIKKYKRKEVKVEIETARRKMLLFSTILSINKRLTKELFIKLVIEWNQGSPHTENVIPDIVWNGDRNIRYGDNSRWLDIQEYRNKNIIAVRYEKIEKDGVVWDTDYVMNFSEMKMAIRLDRSYKEEALVTDANFSTPHFITLLIERGYLKDDEKMPILKEPIYINDDNLELLADVINEKVKYRLPVVYVSKTVYNHDPVNIGWLSSRLKGIAHVLVQSERKINKKCRCLCNDKNEYNGSIGIYFSNAAISHQRYLYRRDTGTDGVLFNKVVRAVVQYSIVQNIDNLYTWQGVNNALLTDKLICQREERIAAEQAKLKTEDETYRLLDAFDDDMKNLQKQVEELTRSNDALRFENQRLREKLSENQHTAVLYAGDEDEFFPDEIKDILLDALNEAAESAYPKSRRQHVLYDIVRSNKYENILGKKQNEIKKLLKGYKNVNGVMKKMLAEFGFEIVEEGKHYKLTYYGDRRYWTTIAKTPSDDRTGGNVSATIFREMM